MRSDNITNILVAGVGGQGVILASDLMAEAFFAAGHDVKKSEVHGMAQRGGVVSSHVRYGKKVFSPIIKMGEVDYLCALEALEGLRWLPYCHRRTVVLMDNKKISPPVVNLGEMEYPNDIEENLRKYVSSVYVIPATSLAAGLGDERVANVVLLGAFSNLSGIEESIWLRTLLTHLPGKLHALNREAFLAGRKYTIPSPTLSPSYP